MNSALLLNADFSPIKVISWERALCMVMDDKAYLVHEYTDRFIRSASLTLAWPAVIALWRFHEISAKVRFNRANLLARDKYECLYCGVKPVNSGGAPNIDDLTLDHVVPRAQAQSGFVTLPWNKATVPITCWENVVSACRDCNSEKADRTPAQANMTLRRLPFKPSAWDAVRMSLTRHNIPDEWRAYLPMDSPWREYWDGDLDSD